MLQALDELVEGVLEAAQDVDDLLRHVVVMVVVVMVMVMVMAVVVVAGPRWSSCTSSASHPVVLLLMLLPSRCRTTMASGHSEHLRHMYLLGGGVKQKHDAILRSGWWWLG